MFDMQLSIFTFSDRHSLETEKKTSKRKNSTSKTKKLYCTDTALMDVIAIWFDVKLMDGSPLVPGNRLVDWHEGNEIYVACLVELIDFQSY